MDTTEIDCVTDAPNMSKFRSLLGQLESEYLRVVTRSPAVNSDVGERGERDHGRHLSGSTAVTALSSEAVEQRSQRTVRLETRRSSCGMESSCVDRDMPSRIERQTSQETKPETRGSTMEDRDMPSRIERQISRETKFQCLSSQHTNNVMYTHLADKLSIYYSEVTKARTMSMAQIWLQRADRSFQERHSTWHQRLQGVVSSPRFESACVLMILLNAVLIAAATEHEAVNSSEKLTPIYSVLGRLFTAWFLFELIARCTSKGLYFFVFSPDWAWNYFDALIVVSDIAQFVLEVVSDFDNAGWNSTTFKILRILRVVRVLRILKLVKFFKEFRLMVMSVLKSGLVLFWSALFLFMIMFVFAIYLTQNVSVHLRDSPRNHNSPILRKYFGTLESSLYTLFLTVSGGVSWDDAASPLFDIHFSLGIVFTFYVFFGVFSMLNVITATFVDTVMASSADDHEEVVRIQLEEYEHALKQLSDIFIAAAKDEAKTMTFTEFDDHLRDHRAVAILRNIGISIQEARTMFKLLDADADDRLSLDEFVFGCLKIKGSAKSIDLQMLMVENRKMMEFVKHCFTVVLNELQLVRKREGSLYSLHSDSDQVRPFIGTAHAEI